MGRNKRQANALSSAAAVGGRLRRIVRPEGQKGAPRLEDVRSPRKTAGPRKRRSAARRIAGSACCTSAGGPKGLKPLEHGGALEQVAVRIKRVMGLTFDLSGMPKACPLEGMVRRRGGAHDLNSSEMFTEHTV